jgi:hypothetical protein
MKTCFTLLIAIRTLHITAAQTTFNVRDNFGFPAALMTSVFPTDSCYYFTGIIADSIAPFKTGNIFLKLSPDGQHLILKTLRSSIKTYETWLGNLLPMDDGNLIDIGFSVDSTTKAIVIKYTPEGDTILTKEYFSYYYPNNPFIVPHQIIKASDGAFFILNDIEKENTSDNDFSIVKLDSELNILWQKKYGDSWDDIVRSLIVDDSGMIIGSSKESLGNQNFVNRTHLLKIDTGGTLQWQYLSPPGILQDAARDIVKTNDGGLVVASGRGIEVPANPSISVLKWTGGYIFKLDADRKLAWELEINEDFTPTFRNYFSRLIAVDSGNAYIAAGQFAEIISDSARDISAWLYKISSEGKLMWQRKHHIVESNLDLHVVYDLKQTPDGGFILVGEATDYLADTLYQQAWLLKLDSFGCLIPGCHLTPVEEAGQPPAQLVLYPNPAKDFLNFQLRSTRPVQEATFRITDVQGRLVREFKTRHPEDTFIVPVWDWAAGVYFLQAAVKGEIVATERFVVN